MIVCKKKVEVYRYADQHGYGVTMVPCGTTGPYNGKLVQCDECAAKDKERYPQGWRDVPGDTCEHGTHVGDAYGPDYICGYCEDGHHCDAYCTHDYSLKELEAQKSYVLWTVMLANRYPDFWKNQKKVSPVTWRNW